MPANQPELVRILRQLGRAHRGKRELTRALPLLERALGILQAGAPTPAESSSTELELARVLWDMRKDRARALHLAEAALAHGEAASQTQLIEAARSWLASHGPGKQRRRARVDPPALGPRVTTAPPVSPAPATP